MQKQLINPWTWQANFGYSQAVAVRHATETLYCAGQTSVDTDGLPVHEGDIGAQIAKALDNVETVLSEAGLGWDNVVRLNMYTTDIDGFLANYGVLSSRLASTESAPSSTLIGVQRLAFPELLVELEATAIR